MKSFIKCKFMNSVKKNDFWLNWKRKYGNYFPKFLLLFQDLFFSQWEFLKMYLKNPKTKPINKQTTKQYENYCTET